MSRLDTTSPQSSRRDGRPRRGASGGVAALVAMVRFVVVVGLVVVAGASPALAHADFRSGDPAPCAQVGPTGSIALEFSEELDGDSSEFLVLDADGATVATGAVDLGDLARQQAVFELDEPLGPGPYRVEWDVVSATDGDRVLGGYGFAVETEPAADCGPVAVEPEGESGPPLALVIGSVTVTLIGLAVIARFLLTPRPAVSRSS